MCEVRWLPMLFACLTVSTLHAAGRDYPFHPTPFTAVRIDGGFWAPRLKANRDVTVWYDFHKCEQTGRIDNFSKAGRLLPGPFVGIRFNDSDVYKVIEGASYSLATKYDPKLDAYLDRLIAKIAAAQEKDGYLYTARTIDPAKLPGGTGPARWSFLAHSHELYNVGHLYEAAVAHFRATKKRTLLNVAIRNADLIASVFGPGKKRDVPGHEEIEIGLVKLYRVTGRKNYLTLARFFLDERGHARGRKLDGVYNQDHKPVIEQQKAVGHAVRAGYLYAGMADVAALTGDRAYVRAIDAIWDDVISKKLYLTGGIGAQRGGEAFGADYQLPNATAYNETCAAIANILWNQRMFLLHGDAKYIDVLERTLYNGFLSGVSLSGNRFFYPNPLEFDGRSKFNQGVASRSPWFGCSCCPVNVVRTIPSIAGYVYAVRDRDIYVNLFANGTGRIALGKTTVTLVQQTRYPWVGKIRIEVDPGRPTEFSLNVRIPGWAVGRPVPSNLYHYADRHAEPYALKVNGQPVSVETRRGFAVLHRTWTKGDLIELDLPMPIRRVQAHQRVVADRDRVALERGPVVYCLEAVDNGGRVFDAILLDSATLTAEYQGDLLGGVTAIRAGGQRLVRNRQGTVKTVAADLRAIPYSVWANRRIGQMRVWIPRTSRGARPAPPATVASKSRVSASHVWQADTVEALHDQIEPKSSHDETIPRHTWWDHRGTSEWVQYDFAHPTRVSSVAVYWFDDTGRGACRVPRSWRLLYRDGKKWKPVRAATRYAARTDRYNQVKFDPVTTSALRIEATLQPGFSAGILEWTVR